MKGGLSLRGAGVLVWALAAVVGLLSFARYVSLGEDYTLNAVLRHANNVRSGTPVRIAGIDIGEVTSVSAADRRSGGGRVTMRIDEAGLPIHSDAKLEVRQRNFLEGSVAIELRPGSPSAPTLSSGATISARQTRATVQADQPLTETMQADTRHSLQTVLEELSSGLQDEGARGYNRSIPHWEPAYRDSALVNQALLGLRTHDLSSYLRGAGRTAAAIDRDPAALQAFVSGFNNTMEGFARNDERLSAALAELPRTLRAALPALRELNGGLPRFRRLISAIRPAIRSSDPALSAGLPLVRELHELVQPAELHGLAVDLARTAPPLTRLSSESVPLFEQLRLASSCQVEVGLPWSRDEIDDPDFPATGPVYVEGPKLFPAVIGQGRGFDANGLYDRVLLQSAGYATAAGQGRFLLTSNPVVGFNPPPPKSRPPFRPDVPCETQEPPDLRTEPLRPANQLAVRPTNRRVLDHYVDRELRSLRELGRRQGREERASRATALLRELMSPGGALGGRGGAR